MANEAITAEEQKKLVLMGKKRPMNLAYNPGPKGADLMIIHRIKAPDVLARTAKKQGEGTRVAFGSFEVDARKFILTAEQALPGLSKSLRKYLKTLDLSFKVEILDGQGNLLEEDDEVEAEIAPADPKLVQRQITNRIRFLQDDISALGPTGAPLKKTLPVILQAFKGGDYDKTRDMLGQVEDKVEQFQEKAATQQKEAKTEVESHPPPKELMARAASLKAVLPDLDPEAAPKVRNALVQAIAQLQARDFNQANDKLAAVEKVVNALALRAEAAKPKETPAPQEDIAAPEAAPDPVEVPVVEPLPSPEQTEWEASQADLSSTVEAAIQSGRGDVDAINRAFAFAQKQAAAGNYEGAVKAAAATEQLIEEARNAPEDVDSAPVEEAPELTPDNILTYKIERTNWSQTRNGLRADLAKLKMAIDARTGGVDGMENVSDQTGALLDYLHDLDTSLEEALDTLRATPDGIQRQKLKDTAKKIIAQYRTTLDTDFFKAVDNNGFIETNIRDTALDALQGVETALAA